ncbi:MAG: PAC2 family protein [Actinomycetota bacterium]|nr:PAC2 family protein [Actinomycetota bacterium]
MDPVRRLGRPSLRRPRAVLAFEGWNDASDAASGALRHLLECRDVRRPFAIIESEEFFDFQEHRPSVFVQDGSVQAMTWPETRFYAIERPDRDHDLVIVVGDEPTFRWKTFARTVAAVLADSGVESVTMLGAYIGSVTHSAPVPLSAVATDPAFLEATSLPPTDYEGPTGIVAVLGEACKEAGIPATSIWAATPHYLAASPNPMAMRALLSKAGEIVGFNGDSEELRDRETEFISEVDEAVAESDDLAEYVREVAENGRQMDPGRTGELVDEIENFLKEV